ncbi:alpha/beta hydrolase fold domain-containing protein [Aurantimicrobium minutum]|uniref:alpha/beta hydrolase fold domain-containing protein n=1 Tax=Aurantimicrobium minutum TaxID=708131 RepID=UPI002474069E|nr:alpha/beta hydrolase fold domain-containing protein [Aurantimicrobium minutum]MDH6536115.1 monoterpene epsilon-lactone hydrolase [Aurantimicrobium minutum]
MSLSELEALLPVLTSPGAPDFSLPLMQARERFDGMLTTLPIDETIEFSSQYVGGVPGTWGNPKGARTDAVVMFLHGGAYVAGNSMGYRGLAGAIATAAGTQLYSVDYRLAPEHVYPAAIEDAIAAYTGLLAQGFEADHIVISGDSAGGGLALALLHAIKAAGLPQPAAAAVISPWTDLACEGKSMTSKADVDPLLNEKGLVQCGVAYAPNDLATPTASPLIGDLSGFPPLMFQVGTREVLLCDTNRFAARANNAHVDVTVRARAGMVHDFPLLAFALSEGKEAIDEIGNFAKTHLAN